MRTITGWPSPYPCAAEHRHHGCLPPALARRAWPVDEWHCRLPPLCCGTQDGLQILLMLIELNRWTATAGCMALNDDRVTGSDHLHPSAVFPAGRRCRPL